MKNPPGSVSCLYRLSFVGLLVFTSEAVRVMRFLTQCLCFWGRHTLASSGTGFTVEMASDGFSYRWRSCQQFCLYVFVFFLLFFPICNWNLLPGWLHCPIPVKDGLNHLRRHCRPRCHLDRHLDWPPVPSQKRRKTESGVGVGDPLLAMYLAEAT